MHVQKITHRDQLDTHAGEKSKPGDIKLKEVSVQQCHENKAVT